MHINDYELFLELLLIPNLWKTSNVLRNRLRPSLLKKLVFIKANALLIINTHKILNQIVISVAAFDNN
jgi:hypothetical protein